MLDHARRIEAESRYLDLMAHDYPNQKKHQKQKMINYYLDLMNGDTVKSHDVVRDRKKLRKIMTGK